MVKACEEAEARAEQAEAQVKVLSAPVSNVEQGDFLAGLYPTDEAQRRKVMEDKHAAFCYFRGIDALVAARLAAVQKGGK